MLGMIAAGACASVRADEGESSRPMSIHEFSMDSIDGKPVKLSVYKGNVVLLVNTATQ